MSSQIKVTHTDSPRLSAVSTCSGSPSTSFDAINGSTVVSRQPSSVTTSTAAAAGGAAPPTMAITCVQTLHTVQGKHHAAPSRLPPRITTEIPEVGVASAPSPVLTLPSRRPRLLSDPCGSPRASPTAQAAAPIRTRPRALSGFGGPSPAFDGGLEGVIAPGDVLFVTGAGGGLLEIGTAGGLLGHVMLVVEPPHRVVIDSREAHHLQLVWPSGGVNEIWKVRTMESSRKDEGLHEGVLLLHVVPETRRLVIIGELADNQVELSGEGAELWQSPEPLRVRLGGRLMADVLAEMRENSASWSWTTAALAVLNNNACHLSESADKAELLMEIQQCWTTDPICTSVVITFWQRCLCKFAGQSASVSGTPGRHPAELVLEWLPLKADRSLPGALLDTMESHGWARRTSVPSASEAPRQSSQMSQVPMQPRYCPAHKTSERRAKVAPRLLACSGCSLKVCSNYAEHALCPFCSEKENRCMCCGATASAPPTPTASQSPRAATSLQSPTTLLTGLSFHSSSASPTAASAGAGNAVGPPASPHTPFSPSPMCSSPVANVPPRYCPLHDRSEKRSKLDAPKFRECKACHAVPQTTYAEFTFCAPCSEKAHRCMICGAHAPTAGSYIPAIRIPAAVDNGTSAMQPTSAKARERHS